MNKKSLQKFEATLIKMRDEIKTPISVKAEEKSVDVVDEDAQPLAEMTQVIASKRNLNRDIELQKIEKALAKIKNLPEDFGLCQLCEEPIAQKRLELMPYVELCVQCQSKKDQTGKQSLGRKYLTDLQ